MTTEPLYGAGMTFEESRELALSEAGWLYVWDADLEVGGWVDPEDDDVEAPTLHGAATAFHLLFTRKRVAARTLGEVAGEHLK